MKRSKIILGMSALALAAFGAFAFKTNTPPIAAFYKPGGVGCESANLTVNCTPHNDGGCLGTSGPALSQQLYNQECEQKLRPDMGF